MEPSSEDERASERVFAGGRCSLVLPVPSSGDAEDRGEGCHRCGPGGGGTIMVMVLVSDLYLFFQSMVRLTYVLCTAFVP